MSLIAEKLAKAANQWFADSTNLKVCCQETGSHVPGFVFVCHSWQSWMWLNWKRHI